MLSNTILVNGLNLKRIGITCRCGNRWVETVPGEVLAGGAVPLFGCAKCGQQYAIRDSHLVRIPDLRKIISEPLVETGITDAEVNDIEVDECGHPVATSNVDTESKQKPGTWTVPGSKLVN